MSRLDHHVASIQNKLAWNKFLDGMMLSALVGALAAWALVRANRMFQLQIPHMNWWIWGIVGGSVAAALVYGLWRRPTAMEAAVQIDEKLNTKDKFATALHVRTMSDPFAHAALLDAERSAEHVVLNKQFPWKPFFPSSRVAKLATVAAVIGISHLFNPVDLFGREEQAKKQAEQIAKAGAAKRQVEQALATVATVPKALQEDPAIKLAKESLDQQLKAGNFDPERAQRTAAKALQDVNEAIKQQIKTNAKYAEAQNDAKMLRQLQVPMNEKGPVADAQRAMAKGDFNEAVNELTKAVDNFDKMDKKEQDKAAQQMKNLANQLQQMAQNNPQQQKQAQQQMQQQLGMNQQQAQQMQNLMQQAAQGNPQAQQQLQQMAQQAMQQMNPQQQQAAQQLINQMQAQANGQQQAQQMAQAAQQMAQAMQQAAQHGGQNQPGQQNQQGQQGQQQAQQQMAGAKQAMQQQMQQMQAMAQDAQQVAAAQQNAQDAAQQAMNGMNGQNGGQAGNNGQPGNNGGNNWNPNGQIAANGQQQDNPWNGQAGQAGPNQGGRGAGDRSYKANAPYDIKPEMSPSQDDEKGKLLAVTLVKASALKGESKEQLKEVAQSAEKDAADEVDQDRVSRQAQRVVRDYFGSMQKDAETAAAPTTAPSN